MINRILTNLVEEKKRQGITHDVIRNLLKEALQFYMLDFIYNSSDAKGLLFTGGSALRICYGLNRLSEDLDFDLETNTIINKEDLADTVVTHFKKKLSFKNIEVSISGQGEKIYLKFPILHSLGVAEDSESDKLYVKVEIAENISPCYKTEFLPVSKFNLNFIVKIYTLETLMAGKIIAIIRRSFQKGSEGEITFKGRDYYDLLWFLQKGIKPDMERIKDVLKISDTKELQLALGDKTNKINPSYLKEDLIPLFEDNRFVEDYCKNYKQMAEKYIGML